MAVIISAEMSVKRLVKPRIRTLAGMRRSREPEVSIFSVFSVSVLGVLRIDGYNVNPIRV